MASQLPRALVAATALLVSAAPAAYAHPLPYRSFVLLQGAETYSPGLPCFPCQGSGTLTATFVGADGTFTVTCATTSVGGPATLVAADSSEEWSCGGAKLTLAASRVGGVVQYSGSVTVNSQVHNDVVGRALWAPVPPPPGGAVTDARVQGFLAFAD
jgi:hypothetical protein